jgi:hypothetical protein
MEEWNLVPVGSPTGQNETASTHWLPTTNKRTSRRQEQDIRMALKRGGLAGLQKKTGKAVTVQWAGNGRVRKRSLVSES